MFVPALGWGWQIVVRTLRGERPIGTAKPLWLRRHRTGEDPNWRHAYDWTDQWNIPDRHALHRLAIDLTADALDLERRPLRRWHEPGRIAAHLTGDVLWPMGDASWRLRRSEILNWLDLHHYITPVT